MNNQEERTGTMSFDEILGVVNDAVNDIKKDAKQARMEKFAEENGANIVGYPVEEVKPEDDFTTPSILGVDESIEGSDKSNMNIVDTETGEIITQGRLDKIEITEVTEENGARPTVGFVGNVAKDIDYSYMKEEAVPESDLPIQESISTSISKIGDIFGTTIKDIRQSKQLETYDNQMNSLINLYSEALVGKKLDSDIKNKLVDGINAKGKAIADLSEIEVDAIYSLAGIAFKNMNSKLKENVNPTDVKREFLDVLYQTHGFNSTMDKYKEELQKNASNTQNEIDELLSSLDVLGELDNLQKQISEEKDPEQKKILQNTYTGLYSAVYLGFIKEKLDNKPFKIIIRDCNKEYDKVFKKARWIMDVSKEQFLDIRNLRQHLTLMFPSYETEVKVLVYLICKKLNKRKVVSLDLVSFVNYFVLNVSKLISKMFTEKEKETTMNNIEDILKYIKAKKEAK